MLYYSNDTLYLGGVSLLELASQHGTPLYVYDGDELKESLTTYAQSSVQTFYALRANDRLAVIHQVHQAGLGFSITSLGELEKLLHAGVSPEKILLGGLGKTDELLKRALMLDLHAIQVESMFELEKIIQLCESLETKANLSLRLNFGPSLDASPLGPLSQFGLPALLAQRAYQMIQMSSKLTLVGLSAHQGSMVQSLSSYPEALNALAEVAKSLEAPSLAFLSVGGGMSIRYESQAPFVPGNLLNALQQSADQLNLPYQVYIEPGRALVGGAGVFMSQVIGTKSADREHFLIIDAATSDFISPLFVPKKVVIKPAALHSTAMEKSWTVVGPSYDSLDTFQTQCALSVRAGDYLVMEGAGAYGAVMSSHYHTRQNPTEVWVEDGQSRVIVQPQSWESLWQSESI